MLDVAPNISDSSWGIYRSSRHGCSIGWLLSEGRLEGTPSVFRSFFLWKGATGVRWVPTMYGSVLLTTSSYPGTRCFPDLWFVLWLGPRRRHDVDQN